MAVYDVSEEKTNGTRLTRLLVDGGTHVLKEFLHSIYPRDKLQIVLSKNRPKLHSLKLSRVIFDSQWEKLFPSSGDPPDSDTFDISLLHLLIREICHLTAPLTGWHKMPTEDDDSVEANIARIKCFRNELCHGTSTDVPNDEFEEKWKQVSSCLEALELYAYRQKIERLKSDPIDHDIQRRVEEQVDQWEQLDKSIKVPSCLPDEIPGELMFGRLHETQQVTEAIQSGSVSVVWITGGPGFGKTTVANKAAHELSRLDCERAVLFCSLRSTKSLSEATTLMTLACSENQTQPPENPQHWLLNWSKQKCSRVTFVLDNADEVLEDSDCINEFLNLLENMRRLSGQNITFIITSRMACSTTSSQSKNVRLACLPIEEAKQILLSRVADLESRAKLSKVEKLVELCGFVPIALCIAGSLLSDYNEDELIQSLEDEPSDVLQVGRRSTDQTSVEKSIKRSFEILHEVEQKALVLLCVFPGSFNSDAAKSLIANCTTNAKSVSVLQELKDRSLVEQLRPCRYQVHQLIQTFVQKIASDKYPGLLDLGEKLACAHFISRLADNANLYWSKDTCKQSVDSFNEDRHNFEYFLQVYTHMRRNIEDQEIVKSCKTFLDDLPQKCMYLEKCVLPRFYIFVLERLLEMFHSESEPVHRVELLCILGHESRKKGDRENYQEFMREAEEIHTKNRVDFETHPLSETYFRNSCARFFSGKKDPLENKRRDQETEAALKVSRENLGDHPETAATLLLAGIIAQRRKKWDEAEQKFFAAWELFKKCLGKHFMTAEILKAIADLHAGNVFRQKSETELDKSLTYYAQAIEIFEDLEFRQSKESIATLKNFGMCHMRKGNLDEAMALLTEADEIAEKELEPCHTWKVKTKTALATLHDKMGNVDQAKAVMHEGLSMGKKLDLEIDEMGNKYEILVFINRHPQTFPEIEFPSE